MDMEKEEAGEFQEWEILQNSETGSVRSPEYHREFGEIGGYSESFIRSDYFAIDSVTRGSRQVPFDDVGFVEPFSEPGYGENPREEVGFEGITPTPHDSAECLSNSGCESSDSQKLRGSDLKAELVSGYNSEGESGFEEVVEENQGIVVNVKDSSEIVAEEIRGFEGNHGLLVEDDLKVELGFEGITKVQTIQSENKDDSGENEILLDSVGGGGKDGLSVGNFDHLGTQISSEEEVAKGSESSGGVVVEEAGEEEKSMVEGKKEMVWWKLPFKLLKFCVFRVSPVWTIAVAAAVVGLALLRRRIYKMKRKSQSLQVKLSFDDKKVSRFNEAISVVRRVPIIRHSLPAAGLGPWNMMSLR